MGLLQLFNRHRTYLTVALPATLQSSNTQCSSRKWGLYYGIFSHLCIQWGLYYEIFSHPCIQWDCTMGSSHIYAFSQTD